MLRLPGAGASKADYRCGDGGRAAMAAAETAATMAAPRGCKVGLPKTRPARLRLTLGRKRWPTTGSARPAAQIPVIPPPHPPAPVTKRPPSPLHGVYCVVQCP